MNAPQPLLPILTAILLSACASSYADASGAASRREGRDAYRTAPSSLAVPGAPYQVQVESAEATTLPTFAREGHTYVMGTMGERYRLHITNPTAARVEAVISVDGLDAIDGEPADFVQKRGYVIGAHDELVVEGFRTSVEQVASFRFASVPESYAARKGKDRNVGVIGVAFFPERQAVRRRAWDAPFETSRSAPASPDAKPRERSASAEPSGGAEAPERAPLRDDAASRDAAPSKSAGALGRSAPFLPARRGLGTEFGEARASHVDSTRFQRARPSEPAEVAELHYDDRLGLIALGIDVGWPGAADDLALRESAQPFPRRTFASPPPR